MTSERGTSVAYSGNSRCFHSHSPLLHPFVHPPPHTSSTADHRKALVRNAWEGKHEEGKHITGHYSLLPCRRLDRARRPPASIHHARGE